jgi:hypothetical protein
MDCVEELAKSPIAKISISRAEPDLRGPVGAPSGHDRSLRKRDARIRPESTDCVL